MSNERGFTLIETLIATVILIAGIVAVAQLFAYSTQTNAATRQMTSSVLLLTGKMEALRALGADALVAGGSLDPDAPEDGYWEYVSIGPDGAVTADTTTANAPFLRLWQIDSGDPRSITVIVFSQRFGIGGQPTELARGATQVTQRF